MNSRSHVIATLAGAMLIAVMASAAPRAAAADPLVLGDVAWSAAPARDGRGDPRLSIRHKSSNSDIRLDGARSAFGLARSALATSGPVRFSVTHEAGRLDCSGRLRAAFDGDGNCRFTSDPRFEAQLAARGLSPERRSDMLAMLVVDATIALADGLSAEGVRPDGADDLVAAAALKITPAYVRELRSGAMTLTDVEDAIACKALGVDGAYVRGLARAGYAKLDADAVVAMKAMGVTPDYARAMNAAAKGQR